MTMFPPPPDIQPISDTHRRRNSMVTTGVVAALALALIAGIGLWFGLRPDRSGPDVAAPTPVPTSITLAPGPSEEPTAQPKAQVAPSATAAPTGPAVFVIGKRLGTGRTISHRFGGHILTLDVPNHWRAGTSGRVWRQPGQAMDIRAGGGVFSAVFLMTNPAPRVSDLRTLATVTAGRLTEIAYRGVHAQLHITSVTPVRVGARTAYRLVGSVSYNVSGFTRDIMEFLVIDLGGGVRAIVGLSIPQAVPNDLNAGRAVLHSLVIG